VGLSACCPAAGIIIIPLGKKFYVGTPIVRYYWHRFLMENLKDFKGAGIEIDSKETINRYSQLNREKNGNGLEIAHAIDIAPGGDHEYVADVAECWNIPANKYDIFLVQFSFHMIQRDREALYHSIRILKEGGILLCNFPCMTGYFPKGLTYKEFTGYIYRWYTPAGVALYLKEMGLAEEDYELVVNGNWLSKLLYASFYIPKEIVPSFMLTKDNPAIPVLVSVRIKKPRNWKPLLQPVNEQHIAA
jgi:SAM-dependent methyltransferase